MNGMLRAVATRFEVKPDGGAKRRSAAASGAERLCVVEDMLKNDAENG
jgi:hypothetical protein